MVPNIKTEMPWTQHDYPGCRDLGGSWSPTDLRTTMTRTPGYHPLHSLGGGEMSGPCTENKPMIQAAALAGYSGTHLPYLQLTFATSDTIQGLKRSLTKFTQNKKRLKKSRNGMLNFFIFYRIKRATLAVLVFALKLDICAICFTTCILIGFLKFRIYFL